MLGPQQYLLVELPGIILASYPGSFSRGKRNAPGDEATIIFDTIFACFLAAVH